MPKAPWYYRWFSEDDFHALRRLKRRNPKSYLKRVYNKNSYDAIGFKIFQHQHPWAMEHLIHNKYIKKIFLKRDNLLKSFVSEQIAMETGRWDRLNQEEVRLNSTKVELSTFLNYKKNREDFFEYKQEKLRQTQQSFLELSYEEITSKFPTDKVEKFLGTKLKNIKLKHSQKKQNPFSLREMISNFQEIKTVLIDNQMETYLETNE